MRVAVKGIHSTKKRLSDGSVRTYLYAWKGGPRILADPGTQEFFAEYQRHIATRKQPEAGTFQSIIALYKQVELPTKAAATRRSYTAIIKQIESEYGDMPIAAIEERGSRAEFLAWRQGMADKPRTADLAWSVLQRIMAFGVDQELLSRNPCEKAGRLADSGTRRDAIWTPSDIAKIKEKAPRHILDVFMIALWTGQRQGDILALQWGNYDGKYIRLVQSKGKRRVTVKVSKEAAEVLNRRKEMNAKAKTPSTHILTTSAGTKWTADGFRASWRKAVEEAGVKGLTFHDIRGTFVTLARRAGSTIEEIAQISGHSINDVKSILEKHYLADDPKVSEGVILRMERNGKRTKSSNQLQTATNRSSSYGDK